jgi:thiol-disulfide isomerase/thioredoxin
VKRLAFAALCVACGGSKAPATVTVQPLPPTSAQVATDAPPLAQPISAPSGDAAPEVLAPGKVTLVHFFASWCMPCAKSMPDLDAVYTAHHGHVAVIGVGEDDDEPDMRAFVAQLHTTYTVLWDSAKSKATRWRVTAMPTTYVIDKHGALRFTHLGYADGARDTIETEVRSLLAEP